MNKVLIIALSIFWALVGNAQVFTPVQNQTEFQTQLKNSAEKAKTITATFDQLKFLSFMDENVKSSGKFYFAKPNKIRWEYIKPSPYYIVINDNTITTFMNGKKTSIDASKNKTFSAINKIMIGSINGDIASNEDFETSIYESENQYRLNLKPINKTLQDVMSEIIIWFDKSDMSVSKIKMLEASDDYSVITLANKKLNEAISSSTFNP